MKSIRFVHCADLHIDSPFKGISAIDPALGEMLRHSTYQAFNNIVDLAIREKVDAVLIAGDIYDSADKSLRAQLKFRDGLNRLSDNGISTFIVCGNHDPLNGWSATLEWPENVFLFSGGRVECVPLQKNGEIIAQICGISFPEQEIYDDLALKFMPPEGDTPRIGLLHTNVGKNTGHEPYAPTSIETLSASGMDYWALGHVHAHSIVNRSNPAIVYPGCSQSRNARETGAKGCCLVTLTPMADPEIQFIPTDVVRYQSNKLDISACTTISEVNFSVEEKCQEVAASMDNRHAIIRLVLTGRTELQAELQRGDSIEGIQDQARSNLKGGNPQIWLEKLELNTAGTYDLETLRSGNTFIADIISIYDALEKGEGEYGKEMEVTLETIFSKWPGRKYLEQLSQEEVQELTREARSLTLDKLTGIE